MDSFQYDELNLISFYDISCIASQDFYKVRCKGCRTTVRRAIHKWKCEYGIVKSL